MLNQLLPSYTFARHRSQHSQPSAELVWQGRRQTEASTTDVSIANGSKPGTSSTGAVTAAAGGCKTKGIGASNNQGIEYVNFNGHGGRGGGVVAVRRGGGVASVGVQGDNSAPGVVG